MGVETNRVGLVHAEEVNDITCLICDEMTHVRHRDGIVHLSSQMGLEKTAHLELQVGAFSPNGPLQAIITCSVAGGGYPRGAH
jgi:hypothetical protein